MSRLTLGIIFGLIACFSAGLSNALVKVPTKELGANKVIFYRNIFNTIFLLIIVLLTLDKATFSPTYILITLGLSFFGYWPMYFFYRAASIGKVGIISPIASANSMIAVILATFLFNEKLSVLQLFSIIVIVVGVILISINPKDFDRSSIFKVSSGIPYALLAALGWGIWMALIKIPITHLGPYLTSFIVEAGALITAFFILRGSRERLVLQNKKLLNYIIPISLLMVLWSVAYYQGVNVSDVSIVVAISSASPVVVALYGRLFYKEKLETKQYFSIALLILGIILLGIG